MGSKRSPVTRVTQRLQPIFRALSSRNYRLFFAGQGISLIGTWMSQVATIWLVYQLTNSPFLLGLVGFASQVPNFIMAPFGGLLVDRWNRHRLIIIMQVLMMLITLTLAALTLTHTLQMWHIFVLSAFQGIVRAFEIPARQSFVVEMVERREDLGNAIALNSSIFNGARFVGPAIAGLLLSLVGAGICFLIDGMSYIAVIMALLAMNVKPRERMIINANPWQHLKEGFLYAVNFLPSRTLLMLLSLISLMGMPYTVLIPVFAIKILRGDAQTLGFLMAAAGVGALIAAVYLSAKTTVRGLEEMIAIAPAILGLSLIIFALSRSTELSLLMMFAVGFSSILQVAASNTILQTIIDDDKRGRMMSFYTMSFMGMMPIGNLLAGTLADQIGVSFTLSIGGIVCILGSYWFYQILPQFQKIIYQIYHETGVLSPSI